MRSLTVLSSQALMPEQGMLSVERQMVALSACCRGYLVSWDVEKSVWWRAFKSTLEQQPQDCGLLMTEPPFNLPSIQTSTMQVSAGNCQRVRLGPSRKQRSSILKTAVCIVIPHIAV